MGAGQTVIQTVYLSVFFLKSAGVKYPSEVILAKKVDKKSLITNHPLVKRHNQQSKK